MASVDMLLALTVCFLVFSPGVPLVRRVNRKSNIDMTADVKEMKKILRTHNNVLIIFAKTVESIGPQMALFEDVAIQMKGLATLLLVDCSEAKKLCKKMKASPTTTELKHYKDGEFNKDYDRMNTIKSMMNFLRDPTGDLPWEEDADAGDVVHIEQTQGLTKLLRIERKPILLMIYVPWCGFCKKLKPDFSAAATELKGQHVLAGVNVEKPETMQLRTDYNITGFPTLLYFEKGKLKMKYGGESNKDGIISWMKNPQPAKEPEKEAEWAEQESDVAHLTDASFDEFISTHPSVLVMFYAPWCGHCKQMKPEYTDAAARLKEDEVEGILAAIDTTKEKKLGDRFKIKGFPTVKYFKDGKEAFDFNERTADKLVEFLKDPQEPAPPPPPEPSWADVPSDVIHLTEENFKPISKKKKHALVMFYAPWCGHCKRAKPEFMAAALKFKDDTKVAYLAVDCTTEAGVCSAHEVTGYPTFKYFNYGKNAQKYSGGREEPDFIKFMSDPLNPSAMKPPLPPSPESHWNDVAGHENIHHLTDTNFDSFLKDHPAVLVMFYAPWCGHCKMMKPAYSEAATILKEQNINGVLAAVDATSERTVSSRFDIKGFPTLKYFENGEVKMEYEGGRSTEDLVGFMKSPVDQPPPPVDPVWSDEPSAIEHLSTETFAAFMSKSPAVLVMFYAPWCGHCKKAKPAFTAAAEAMAGAPRMALAAIDCTTNSGLCQQEQAQGYPSFRFYSNGKFLEKYSGGREKDDFISFMASRAQPAQKDPISSMNTRDAPQTENTKDTPQAEKTKDTPQAEKKVKEEL